MVAQVARQLVEEIKLEAALMDDSPYVSYFYSSSSQIPND